MVRHVDGAVQADGNNTEVVTTMRSGWYGILLILLSISAVDGWAKERVFVLAGQSNMMGRGKINDLPLAYRHTPSNVRYFSQGREHPLAKFAYFGPEIGLAHALARAFPRDEIILVKQAASGSLIGQWQPGEPLYKGLLRQVGFVHDAYPAFRQVDAIVWMQGESDAQSELPVARQYGSRLQRLVGQLRHDLDSPDSLFVYGQTSVNHPAFQAATAAVRQQQEAAQRSLANVLMVSTEQLGRLADGIHYDAAGQLELGRRFAQAYIQRLQ